MIETPVCLSTISVPEVSKGPRGRNFAGANICKSARTRESMTRIPSRGNERRLRPRVSFSSRRNSSADAIRARPIRLKRDPVAHTGGLFRHGGEDGKPHPENTLVGRQIRGRRPAQITNTRRSIIAL